MTQLFYITRRDKNGWEKGEGSKIKFQGKRRMIEGELKMDAEKKGDGKMWMMQRGLFISAVYTNADRIENEMYDKAPVLQDGEIVEIIIIADGDELKMVSQKQYRFKANGDYSDAGIFEEI